MMDRSREPKRVNNMAAGNGLSRRSHRSAGATLRDSPEDGGQAEETAGGRLRDRVTGKKERERDRADMDRSMMLMMSSVSSRSKRRRAERLLVHQNHNHSGGRHFDMDDSSEESINEDDEEEDDEGETIRMLPPHNPSNHSSLVSSSSPPLSNHNPNSNLQHSHSTQRKGFSQFSASHPSILPNKVTGTTGVKGFRRSPTPVGASSSPSVNVPPPWASHEMMGVSVPRKARSASTKRPHENRTTVGGGGAHSNDRNTSSSPVRSGGPSVPATVAPTSVSPSSSNVTVKKRMKTNGPKQKPLKSSCKSVSSTQDEIEFEIAEVLYGLMRQPQGPSVSAKPEAFSGDDGVKGDVEVKEDGDTKSRVSSPLPQSSVSTTAPKRKRPRPVKYEDDNSTIFPIRSISNSPAMKADRNPLVSGEPCSASELEHGASAPKEMPEEVKVEEVPGGEKEGREMVQSVKKEVPRSPSSAAVEADKSGKATKITVESESQRGEKFEIDLMAPPPAKSPPELDTEVDFGAAGPKPISTDAEPASVKKDTAELIQLVKEDDCREKHISEDKVIDLQIDLERTERDAAKHHNGLKNNEKSVSNTNSIPVPLPMAGWPGGIPHMGYMTPLQGVVSVDANALPSPSLQPPHMLFNQHRLKRCATHCCIARNIYYHQQLSRMSPFWPSAAGSALPYGGKLNVPPSVDGRNSNSVPEKVLSAANASAQSANAVDAAQRKQILIRQPLPSGGPSNILHGPAFIFPLSQQQASVRPGGGAHSSAATSSSIAPSSSAAAMNFSYPNMGPSEAPYLAILQNGAYPIPVPTHMGSAPAFRGGHPQTMPFYNGSFYSSQIIHPSQIPQQQPQQNQRGISAGGSSHKPLPDQSQKAVAGVGTNTQNFPTKNLPSPSQFPQRQPAPSSKVQLQGRLVEGSDNGNEESPTAPRTSNSVYGQNLVVPIHPSNFAFMAGNMNERKQQSQSPAFAMSFTSINGGSTAAGFDISSIAHNPALLQTLPEAARHGFHFMQAATAPKGKSGGNEMNSNEEERKSVVGGNTGSSIAFSRTDITDSGSVAPPISGNSGVQQRVQQQQMMQHQKHQQFILSTTAAKSKAPAGGTNGSVFSDHVPSPSSTAGKFSSQWKNSARTGITQVRPPTQPSHAQISFGGNPKAAPAQGNSNQSNNQSPPPVVPVGSPTRSISKSAGSPRTTTTSTSANNKVAVSSSQPLKSLPANGGRNVSSMLGHNLHTGASKIGLPHAQIYSGSYVQSQPPSNPSAGGFYLHRHRSDQQPIPQYKGAASSSPHGMLSLCPTVPGDQGKAAGSVVKGAAVSHGQFAVPQASGKQHPMVPGGFSYGHGGVQVKQADQKQPAGE